MRPQMPQISLKMAEISKLIPVLMLLCIAETDSLFPKRIHRDFRYPVIESFDIYWNVPTYMCQRFNINFEPQLKKYGLIVNKNDSFRGENIIILYDPGLFPAMLLDTITGKLQERNGGIPQLGNIDDHLNEFRSVIEKVVPKNFNGVGIIDFEAWRPVWRQNWNDQVLYKNMSIDLEKQRHPQLGEKEVLQRAKANFEAASKIFMDDTLNLAKKLRPNAKWGYYGFPYCYNSGKEGSIDCAELVQNENNQIQWLFSDSTAFYPSMYVNNRINANEVKLRTIGRLNEAWRLATRVSKTNPPPVYPYVGFKYTNNNDFLTEDKLYNILEATRKYKMGGAIIWGSSNLLKTEDSCNRFYRYLQQVLGPTIVRVKGNSKKSENVKTGDYTAPVPGIGTGGSPQVEPYLVSYEDRFAYSPFL